MITEEASASGSLFGGGMFGEFFGNLFGSRGLTSRFSNSLAALGENSALGRSGDVMDRMGTLDPYAGERLSNEALAMVGTIQGEALFYGFDQALIEAASGAVIHGGYIGARTLLGGRGAVSHLDGLGPLERLYYGQYTQFSERGLAKAQADLAQGITTVRNGQSLNQHLGIETDTFARDKLQKFARSQGHGEDVVRINRRLYTNGDSSAYRIPDLQFPQSNTIFDLTLGTKTLSTPQIKGFRTVTDNPIYLIRPQSYGGNYQIPKVGP